MREKAFAARVVLSWSLCACVGAWLLAACPGDDGGAAPTVANPTVRGVTCDRANDDGGTAASGVTCSALFEECSDGLTYELECNEGRCECFADGDKLGAFESQDSPCDIDIGQLKLLCGWL